jgi:hypothetical protein
VYHAGALVSSLISQNVEPKSAAGLAANRHIGAVDFAAVPNWSLRCVWRIADFLGKQQFATQVDYQHPQMQFYQWRSAIIMPHRARRGRKAMSSG